MYDASSNIMNFYKAERNRVLWLRGQRSYDDGEKQVTNDVMEMEIVNDENTPVSGNGSITAQPRSGCKRAATPDLSLLLSDSKRAKIM